MSLFVRLRDDFPDFLDDAARQPGELELWERLARVGFSLFESLSYFTDGDSGYVQASLLSQEREWAQSGEAPARRAFTALALGALLGQVEATELTEFDLVLEEASLKHFVAENAAVLAARYHEARAVHEAL